jgi:hypothetical protein
MIDIFGDMSTKICNRSCMSFPGLTPRFENWRFLITMEFRDTLCYSEDKPI